MNKLKTSLGKPQETFLALEGKIREVFQENQQEFFI
jgi:hypothetical protein